MKQRNSPHFDIETEEVFNIVFQSDPNASRQVLEEKYPHINKDVLESILIYKEKYSSEEEARKQLNKEMTSISNWFRKKLKDELGGEQAH